MTKHTQFNIGDEVLVDGRRLRKVTKATAKTLTLSDGTTRRLSKYDGYGDIVPRPRWHKAVEHLDREWRKLKLVERRLSWNDPLEVSNLAVELRGDRITPENIAQAIREFKRANTLLRRAQVIRAARHQKL